MNSRIKIALLGGFGTVTSNI